VKLFLGGLSWETSEGNIRKHFERFGEIQEVVNTFLSSSELSATVHSRCSKGEGRWFEA